MAVVVGRSTESLGVILGIREAASRLDLGPRIAIGAWSWVFFYGGVLLVEANDTGDAAISIGVGLIIAIFAIVAKREWLKVVWPFESAWKRK